MRHPVLLVLAAAMVGGCASREARHNEQARAIVMSEIARAVEAAEPIDPVASAAEPVHPSLQGLERTHWPTIIVHTDRGSVRHGRAYLSERWNPALDTRDLGELSDEERAELAFSTSYEGSAWAAAAWEPVQFVGQILMLPVSLVTQPPTGRTSSPPPSAGK